MKFACRPCVLHSSDNSTQSSEEVMNNLSKFGIKDVEKLQMDRISGIPMTRMPLQVPSSNHGMIFLHVRHGERNL